MSGVFRFAKNGISLCLRIACEFIRQGLHGRSPFSREKFDRSYSMHYICISCLLA